MRTYKMKHCFNKNQAYKKAIPTKLLQITKFPTEP